MADRAPTVLVVDDVPGLLRLIGRILEREGLSVLTASTGSEALKILQGTHVDLLLLDLKLPGLSGGDLVAKLASGRPTVPFVIITGQGDERIAVDMMKCGALDYLVKDAEFLDRLPARVLRALEQVAKDRKIAVAEEAFRQEHAFSTALLDVCGALVVALDREGRIVRFNSACERTTGYAAPDAIGRHFWDLLIPPEEIARFRTVFDRLRAGERRNEFETSCLTRDGRRRLVIWSNGTLFNPDGSVEYIIATGLDVTQHRQLEQEILQVSELEQRRIGHDLHDGICQHLAAIELMSQVLKQNLARRSKTLARHADQIACHVRDTLSQTRMLARGLSPVVVESDGLMSALQELAVNTEKLFKVRCRFDCSAPVLVSDHATAIHLYRIAQEAVSNAVKHGRAPSIQIALAAQEKRIALEIADDGTGLPPDADRNGGMGLHIMQYRAAMIAGSLSIKPRRRGGTRVVCSVPIQSETHPASREPGKTPANPETEEATVPRG